MDPNYLLEGDDEAILRMVPTGRVGEPDRTRQ